MHLKTARTRAFGRKRWWALFGVLALTIPAVNGASEARAVHDTGAFELDGDATDNTTPPNTTQLAGDDWSNVYCQVTQPNCATPTTAFGGATAVTWSADGSPNATIFTTGGSKDPQDVPNWRWKDGAGGLPDKDNLQDAFAARYSLPDSATCDSGTFATCELLFFGSDRFDNSGDAQQAFWFFQNPIGLKTDGTFAGVHKVGDLLVISDFSNGGTTSTIKIYEWVGSGGDTNGTLNFVAGSDTDPAKCGINPTDTKCGIVNPVNGTVAPWPFIDKGGNSTYLQGEFFEGGINLSAIGAADECFSSVAAETRSSTSPTATLKDFVLASFAPCTASITTTPSAGVDEQTAVSPGVPVTDLAVVQGKGTANPPTPTGTVAFFICGPTAVGSTDLCQVGGTQVGGLVPLADSSPPVGEASATSAQVNTPGSPLLPGRYCFRAVYSGDAVYPGPVSEFGIGNSECFVVRQIPTSTVTTPSDGSGVALTSPVPLGTTIFDRAVVTGNLIGGPPPGTVNFFLCNPATVTANGGTCSTGGTAVGSKTLSAINATQSAALSDGTAANTAGVWCFRATYVPTGTTYVGSSDATTGECVTVSPANTGTVTTPRVSGSPITGPVPVNTSVVDHAVVTGVAAGGSPTGTVNFFICTPTEVAANGGTCSTGGTAAGSVTPLTPGANNTATADSDAVIANVVGTWCFRAEYVSNTANYLGSSDASTGECFVVNDSSAAASQQDWLPNDSAQITTLGGTALDGSLTFVLYSSADCTGTVLYTEPTINLVGEASGTPHSTDNTDIKVTATTTVSWLVTFTSTNPLVSGSSHCEKTVLTITN